MVIINNPLKTNMAKSPTITVSYLVNKKKFKDIDGILQIKADRLYKTYSVSGIKRYNNALAALAGVNGLARDLLEWLTVRMTTDNEVYNTFNVRRLFIAHIKEIFITKAPSFDYKAPSDRSVKAGFAKLVERNILIPRSRGEYFVNPEYFMNPENEDYRGSLIKLVLEFQDDKETEIKRVIEKIKDKNKL